MSSPLLRLFAIAALMSIPHLATAHMEMTSPPPLKSKSNLHTSPSNVDYSMTSPLHADGSDFPCKGYLSLLGSPDGQAVATWNAGGTYNFTVAGGAPHGGGSCQAALSVDAGRTFRVLHSYEGGCPGLSPQSSFGFVLPRDVPATKGAVFAWTWFNNLGNREMYMNCAVVDVAGGSGGGSEKVAFGSRPVIFKANVGNGCRTVDSANVKFPDPGPDVDANGPATPPTGSCGAAASSGGEGGSGSGAGSASGGGSGGGSGGTAGGSGGNAGSSSGGSGENSGPGETASPSAPGQSPSETVSPPAPHRTSRPSPAPVVGASGSEWTPGNDWPDWFQSPATRPCGGAYLAVFLWAMLFAYYMS